MNAEGPPSSIAGMRVLLGPGDTASFLTRLARALGEQGARCWVVDLQPNQYSAGADKLGKAKRWGDRLTGFISRLSAGGAAANALAEALVTVGRFAAFLWALARADALVFVSSRSYLPGYLDLPIYRLLGKRVIRIFLGTDSRPRYMTGWHHKVTDEATRASAARRLAGRVRRQRARVRFMSRHADIVVDNPLCGHYQHRPYINWFHVGFPHDPAIYDAPGSENAVAFKPNGPIKVLHSPSNPAVKGTAQIEAVIDKLKAEGVEIEYTRITGMAHAEVLHHLRHCDLVIDQLYSDSPMAGLASEAVAFGRPVIVGGYGWDILQNRLGLAMPQNLLCRPEQLEHAVQEALDQPEKTREQGEKTQAFMNGYWRQDAVADRFAKLLTGQSIPDDWWVDPRSIEYWQGLGATDEHRRAVIEAVVSACGITALGLEPGQPVFQTINAWGQA